MRLYIFIGPGCCASGFQRAGHCAWRPVHGPMQYEYSSRSAGTTNHDRVVRGSRDSVFQLEPGVPEQCREFAACPFAASDGSHHDKVSPFAEVKARAFRESATRRASRASPS